MILLTLDPSSTRTGYAVMDDRSDPPGIVDAGYLSGRRSRDGYLARIMAMQTDLEKLLDEHRPAVIVIEVPSGRVGRRHGGGGSGLTVYGAAVGWLGCVCFNRSADHGTVVVPTRENDWTRSEPKEVRKRRLAAIYPAHADALARDTGGDLADAIGLGVWWCDRQTIGAGT